MVFRAHGPHQNGPIWIDTSRPGQGRRALGHWVEDHSGQTDRRLALRLGALGPKNTSSDLAARQIAGLLPPSVLAEVVLFQSFDELLSWAISFDEGGAIRCAVVPHASPKTNAFYMTVALDPVWVFPFKTPDYGLAARKGSGPPLPPARITLFPVTYPVLHGLRPGFEAEGFEIVEAGSTSDAAALVAAGLADYAVTNAEAMAAFGLEFVAKHGPIPMTWTAFTRRTDAALQGRPASATSPVPAWPLALISSNSLVTAHG
jgi:prephenate decarboxylase